MKELNPYSQIIGEDERKQKFTYKEANKRRTNTFLSYYVTQLII